MQGSKRRPSKDAGWPQRPWRRRGPPDAFAIASAFCMTFVAGHLLLWTKFAVNWHRGVAANGNNRNRIAPCAGQPCCRTSRLPVPMSCYICPCISFAARCIGGVALRWAEGVTTLGRALWACRGWYSFSPRRPDGRKESQSLGVLCGHVGTGIPLSPR